MTTGDARPDREALLRDLHRPFRPRSGRVVPLVAGAAWLVVLLVIAFTMPGLGVPDRTGFAVLGAAGAALLHRFAAVRALPSDTGLSVQNLGSVRELSWAQIVSVRFGPGATWASLDVSDGSTLSVYAIQRADGSLAEREATRLATLVELHSRTEPDG